jgi:hypothetical protein
MAKLSKKSLHTLPCADEIEQIIAMPMTKERMKVFFHTHWVLILDVWPSLKSDCINIFQFQAGYRFTSWTDMSRICEHIPSSTMTRFVKNVTTCTSDQIILCQALRSGSRQECLWLKQKHQNVMQNCISSVACADTLSKIVDVQNVTKRDIIEVIWKMKQEPNFGQAFANIIRSTAKLKVEFERIFQVEAHCVRKTRMAFIQHQRLTKKMVFQKLYFHFKSKIAIPFRPNCRIMLTKVSLSQIMGIIIDGGVSVSVTLRIKDNMLHCVRSRNASVFRPLMSTNFPTFTLCRLGQQYLRRCSSLPEDIISCILNFL